jgi:ribosome-associated heat shock protein Hsp15
MCKSGKVKIGDQKAKPSQSVTIGDIVQVAKNGFNFQFRVEKLLSKRVGAPIAQEAYEDLTPAEELTKYEDWFVGKAPPEQREKGLGRPTKKDRRYLERFKDDFYFSS